MSIQCFFYVYLQLPNLSTRPKDAVVSNTALKYHPATIKGKMNGSRRQLSQTSQHGSQDKRQLPEVNISIIYGSGVLA